MFAAGLRSRQARWRDWCWPSPTPSASRRWCRPQRRAACRDASRRMSWSLSRSPSTRSACPRLLCVIARSSGESCRRIRRARRDSVRLHRAGLGIARAFAQQRQHGAAVALHSCPFGRGGLARIYRRCEAVTVQRRLQPGRIAVALAKHDLCGTEQRHRARPIERCGPPAYTRRARHRRPSSPRAASPDRRCARQAPATRRSGGSVSLPSRAAFRRATPVSARR